MSVFTPSSSASLRLLGQAPQVLFGDAPASDAAASDATPNASEPSLFYDPPYDTPLDDAVAWHLVKYLDASHGLRYAVNVPAASMPGATADATSGDRVDFVVDHGARRTGFVLTGDGAPGAARASRVAASGVVDVLYRLRRADALHRLHDALLLVSRWDPNLFGERGRTNLVTLASPDARTVHPRRGEPSATVTYASTDAAPACALIDTDAAPLPTLELTRQTHRPPQPRRDTPRAIRSASASPPRLAKSA